jgi:subtilisin family serine protease
MKRTLIGIFIVKLLIITAIPSFGMINDYQSTHFENFWNNEQVPGELIIKFVDPPFSSVSVKDLNDKYQVISMDKLFINSRSSILDNIYILKIPENTDLSPIINDYSKNPNVEYVETNGLDQVACYIPNDANFSEQWHLDNTGQTGGTPDADINAPEAWDITTGSSEVVIAVIDSGIDYSHPDLIDNIWLNEDEIPDNEIDDDGNGYVDDDKGWDWWYKISDILDGMGHGTMCAGIIGAEGNNSIGGSGVCWDCRIMSLKIMNESGWAYFTNIAKAIEYAADNGADIISMSFGFDQNKSYIWDVVKYAYSKNVFLVAACGNGNTSDESYPAAYGNVIAIAGTDHNDNRMNYYSLDEWIISNYGDWIDVCAPGQNVYTTFPTYPVYFNEFGVKSNYDHGGGTSSSCPIVAGVAALMLSKDSTLTPDEIKSNIKKYSDPYDSEYDLGDGRVNAYQAVKKVKSNIPGNITNIARLQTISGLPDYFNWKDFGGQDWTTPAKDQSDPQYCGCCGVFASMGILESVINIREGSAVIDPYLSVQYIMSCLPDAAVVPGEGCSSGYETTRLFELMIATTPEGNYYNGALLEECFSYQADDNVSCDDKCPDWVDKLVPVLDFDEWLPSGTDEDRQRIKSQIMEKGPVLTGMLSTSGFWRWGWDNHDPDDYYPYYEVEDYDHVVIILGWKDDPSIGKGGYWICKNSHGQEWGYDGFFNIEYGSLNIDSIGIDWVAYDPDSYEWVNEPNPPGITSITGETNGDIRTEYVYILNSVDPENHDLRYYISWGDGTWEWTDYYPSGEDVTINHVYNKKGDYSVVSLAMNTNGNIGPWGTLDISMSKAKFKETINPWFERLTEQLPILGYLIDYKCKINSLDK